MFTDDELREACRELSGGPPETAAMLARLSARPARRRAPKRLIAPAMAALTIAALAAAAAILLPGQRPDSPAPRAAAGPTPSSPCAPMPRPKLVDISLRHVAGLANFSRATTTCSGYANRELDTTTGLAVGEVWQYRTGVFDTHLLRHARKVSGHGIQGYIEPLARRRLAPEEGEPGCVGNVIVGKDGHRSNFAPCKSRLPLVLAWEYAPDSWALVLDIRNYFGAVSYFGNDVAHRLLRIAAALDTAHAVPVRIPIAFSHLPARVRSLDVGVYRSRTGAFLDTTIGLGAINVPRCGAGKVCDIGDVFVGTRDSRPHLTGKPIPVGHRTAYLIDQGTQRPDIPLQLWTGRWLVSVSQTADRPLPDSDLVAIARSARFAPTTAMSTWFPVQDALPA